MQKGRFGLCLLKGACFTDSVASAVKVTSPTVCMDLNRISNLSECSDDVCVCPVDGLSAKPCLEHKFPLSYNVLMLSFCIFMTSLVLALHLFPWCEGLELNDYTLRGVPAWSASARKVPPNGGRDIMCWHFGVLRLSPSDSNSLLSLF